MRMLSTCPWWCCTGCRSSSMQVNRDECYSFPSHFSWHWFSKKVTHPNSGLDFPPSVALLPFIVRCQLPFTSFFVNGTRRDWDGRYWCEFFDQRSSQWGIEKNERNWLGEGIGEVKFYNILMVVTQISLPPFCTYCSLYKNVMCCFKCHMNVNTNAEKWAVLFSVRTF